MGLVYCFGILGLKGFGIWIMVYLCLIYILGVMMWNLYKLLYTLDIGWWANQPAHNQLIFFKEHSNQAHSDYR